MEKNELALIESKKNTVLDGTFAGMHVTADKGIVYVGETPLTKDHYKELEVIQSEQMKAAAAEKKRVIGKKVLGLVAVAPVLLPFAGLKKEFGEIGSMIKVVWNSGEESVLFVDKGIAGELLDSDHGFVNAVRDVAGAFLKAKRTPVYLADLQKENFRIPNVLEIVDDALYKNDKELSGAVGWRETIRKTEILFLFDEVIPKCGLTLKPVPLCNSIYHVHNYQRNTFIMLNSLIDTIMEERVAELKHIAFALGAKRYEVAVEMKGSEKRHLAAMDSKNAHVMIVDVDQKQSYSQTSSQAETHIVKSFGEFEDSREPVRPNLMWFQNNALIRELIEKRMDERNRAHSRENIEIQCSSCTAMSTEAAASLDVSIKKIGGGTGSSIQTDVEKESRQSLIFTLEF